MQNILSWIIFTPLIGAAVILFSPKSLEKYFKNMALITTLVVMGLSLQLLSQFDVTDTSMQFVQRIPWIPYFGAHYFVGLDGISLPMVFLTGLIFVLACLASWKITDRAKEYFFLYLLLQTGVLGTFLSLDLFLFYIFWEVVLVPMYFLIGIWGGPRREYAAIKFFIYTLAGSLFMLIGILALYFNSDPYSLDMMQLTNQYYDIGFQKWVFMAFFLGFAIKVPIFPFHTWLPDAHVEAPTPISVILAGVLLKMGTYGFLRFSYPLFPDAAIWFQPAMCILAVIGIVYGGFIALAQNDFKKMVAYSSVSHMGFVLLGLGALNVEGFQGAVVQMFTHGTITAGLFLLVGVLYDRAHTREMDQFGGILKQMPVYGGLLIFFSMASLGLPGLSGFIGEFLCLLGGFAYWKGITAFACLGIILAAAYLLLMVQKVLLGPLNEKWSSLVEINRRELLTLLPLMVFIIAIGIYPRLIVDFISVSLEGLTQIMSGALQS